MIGRELEAAGIFLLDVIYPRRCAGCGARGDWLCARCESADVVFTGPLCRPCGVPLALGLCQCHELPASIASVRSVGRYGGWLRGAVVQIKFHGEWARVGHLAPLLADARRDLGLIDALVPVPLHPARRKQRGFNQSEYLAQAIRDHAGDPVADLLVRVRKTGPQVRLDAAGRQVNVRGAFALAPGAEVRNQRLVLVDDVITTGSTLGACADVLMAAGASSVSVVTVARELS